MDRLLSGDVGFGKTEVAMNAIFMSYFSGFSSLFFVPTTLLSAQHFKTLKERLAPFKIPIFRYDRFTSAKEKSALKSALQSGLPLVCIGTHALLGLGELNIQNVGLIIIDEEHKFGVKQKEKLKEIYPTEINIINKDQHPFVVRTFADLLSKGEKTMPGIIATAKAKLGVFQLPTVAKNTSSSDFKIRDLMASDKPISFYIVIEPGDLQSLAPLIRILIIQCVTLLTPEIDYSGNNKNAVKFKHRLLMLLDEFPSLGKMEILEKAIGYVAGYGMKMMLVVQSLDQLNKIYTKDNAFISNCQTQIFYTANDNQTAEYISQTIGNKTIKSTSLSFSGGIFSSKNITESFQGVPLIRPEEVRRLSLDTILILNASKPPIKSKKILWFYDNRFNYKVNVPIKISRELANELNLQKKLIK